MKHRSILAAVYLLAMFVAPVFAQTGTQPPNGAAPSTSMSVSLCHYDSNDGLVHPETKPRDQVDEAALGTGPATEGQDTRPDDNHLCQQSAAPSPLPTPGTVDASPQQATATPMPTTATVGPSATATATDAPTSMPEPMPTIGPLPTETPTATLFVVVDEPTPEPLPPCVPGGPVPCGGKG